MSKKILWGCLLCLLCIIGLTACRDQQPTEEQTVLMTIDGTSVDQKEGRLYLELIRRTRAFSPDTVFIILSGYAEMPKHGLIATEGKGQERKGDEKQMLTEHSLKP